VSEFPLPSSTRRTVDIVLLIAYFEQSAPPNRCLRRTLHATISDFQDDLVAFLFGRRSEESAAQQPQEASALFKLKLPPDTNRGDGRIPYHDLRVP
jgi:hypothetical protein